jgi:hypothetical protein
MVPIDFAVTEARGRDLALKGTVASLKGTGIRAICENRVVFCNYAFLYDGVFSWSNVIVSAQSKTTEDVTVSIVAGRGSCKGAETITDNGASQTGGISGTALVAVEFVTEPLNDSSEKDEPVYRITVACPTPLWPSTADAAGTPSQPAELGHNDQTTYNIKGVPIGSTLIGKLTYPAPETDSLNGVSGNVTVAWKLTATTKAKPSVLKKS